MSQPEAKNERSARYMSILANKRTAMQDALRAKNDGMTRHKCDDIIDFAIGGVAEETIEQKVDFNDTTATELKARVDGHVEQYLARKPYTGWKLGE